MANHGDDPVNETLARIRLDGRVAIVTGGVGGIGRAAVTSLADLGATVVIADLDAAACEAFAGEIAAGGGQAAGFMLDVSSEPSWITLVADVLGRFGRIDVLANVAGLLSVADVEAETVEHFDRIMAVNTRGTWLGMKHCAAPMRAAGGGSIINIASIAGLQGGFGRAIAYYASKGAIRGLTKSGAVRLAPDQIRVNSIHPGQIDTPMQAKDKGTAFEQRMIERTPLRRLGEPRDIGAMVAYLASDAASFLTGSEIVVDGGWTSA
jgi:3alpha(or 20beta)-hydroxysteroid dehydrogenase